MVASQYFESINDFKNLELATKKAKDNMEKFHFNPISLTRETRKYFTQLETLHVYERGNEEFRDEKFFKRIIHYRVKWNEYFQRKEEDDVYLDVVLDEESTKGMKEYGNCVTAASLRLSLVTFPMYPT